MSESKNLNKKILIGLLSLATLIAGYLIWNAKEHHDMEDGHHGEEQVAPANQDRPGAVRKK